jgi:hypothetical protein
VRLSAIANSLLHEGGPSKRELRLTAWNRLQSDLGTEPVPLEWRTPESGAGLA